MGQNSGGGTNTVQTSLPAYAQPYYERLMAGTEAIANSPYIPYGGEKVAGFNPTQQAGFNMTSGSANLGIGGITAAANDYYNTPGFNKTNVSTGIWDNETAGAYMNPYMRHVTDLAIGDAREKFNQDNLSANLTSAAHGAFGGSRQGLAEAQRKYYAARNEDAIRTGGMSKAYDTGANIFASDQGRGLTALGMNINQEQLRANDATTRANTLASLFGGAQKAGLEGAAAVTGVGNQQQALQQAYDTADYQDFVNQRDYGRQNAAFMSQILHGMPVTPNSDVYTTSPTNPLASGAGAGIAALGLYNQYNKQ